MSYDKIRICWPNPDATCLEGGCIYCSDARPRSLAVIELWAESAGNVANRGSRATTDAADALKYGLTHGGR